VSATLRRRAAIALGSLFAVWHSMVLVLAAMPDSYLSSQVYPFVRPYAEFLHLDGGWAFFAPDPTAGRALRYRLEDAQGRRTQMLFSEAVPRSDPAYLRFTTLASSVDGDSPALMNSVAQMLCRKHTAQHPVRIVFTVVKQLRMTPEQHAEGLRPLDSSLVELVEMPPVTCQPTPVPA
jgi:hypothetical protein